ncbi:MAG: RNA polymerase sigma factor [Planctomycetota bacterium]
MARTERAIALDAPALHLLPDRESDSALADAFHAARTGDRLAFEEIYRRFVRVVHGLILARLGPGDAEDVTQEVFLSVFQKLGSVRDLPSLPQWICTVARNRATDHMRRRLRRPGHEPLAESSIPAGADTGRELREHVMARISSLPDSYRETLVLRLVEGLTGPEIAERTGLTKGSVRVNLSRGMAMLRPLLREDALS